jgi:3-oxoacyl-[acyl-carrier protein] reductase
MHVDLSGKRAIIGGSTQGIGLAIAQAMAQAGASITIVARNEERLRAVLTSLATPAGQVHQYLVADYTQPHLLHSIVEQHLSQNAGYDILVNNTGGPPGGPLLYAKLDELQAALNQHLFCNHIMVQMLVPAMKAISYGRIINIVSTSVREPLAGLGVSNTTRGAVASWAKTLSKELGASGITVNNILPGATETQRLSDLIEQKAKTSQTTSEAVMQAMQGTIPAGRFGTVEEIAALAVFLASPLAAYITGTSIAVDGGRMNSI